MDLELNDVALRLSGAAFAGIVVGVNRDLANKPIGMRTLGLVSLGAAIVTVATLQVPGMSENPDALSPVVQGLVQGVMAGISFIGAGVILRDAKAGTVEGLTTAGSVWIAAALGIACGLAAWRTVAIAMVITILLLFAVGWVERIRGDKRNAGSSVGR